MAKKEEKTIRKPDAEKQEQDAYIHEIRKALIGKVFLNQDKKLEVLKQQFVNPFGFTDGAPEALLFGVMRRAYTYETKPKMFSQARFQAEKILPKIGQSLHLNTAPDRTACLYKKLFFRPVVLVLEEKQTDQGKVMVLNAYCSRAPLSIFSILRAVFSFENRLTKRFQRVDKKQRSEPKKNPKTGK